MALAILDNLTAEVSTLKHYNLTLRNENIEMKHTLADLTINKLELTKEVKLLKDIVSQLMDQQNIFNNSLSALSKETKSLMRDNMQLKSKYDIMQVRLKNLQGSAERDSAQKLGSPRQIFKPEDKEDLLEFQLSPRMENIGKATKDRLEILKKDLEDVFKKKDGKVEHGKGDKETIMDEWSEQSELNISQSHSEKIGVIEHPPGEHSFTIGTNAGHPSSLMEQVEMLSIHQTPLKQPFLHETIFENSSKPGNIQAKKDNIEKQSYNVNIIGGAVHATGSNILSQIKPGATGSKEGGAGRAAGDISPRTLAEEKRISMAKASPQSQPSSHLQPVKQPVKYTMTPSTTIGATQTSLLTSETGSYYPLYSKELYLQGENILSKVLEEQPHKVSYGMTAYEGEYMGNDAYRYLGKDSMKNTGQGYGYLHKIGEVLGTEEAEKINPNDTSATLSSRGTKRLKLGKINVKPKDELSTQKNMNSNYGNQR